jgi:hypothetical protein
MPNFQRSLIAWATITATSYYAFRATAVMRRFQVDGDGTNRLF